MKNNSLRFVAILAAALLCAPAFAQAPPTPQRAAVLGGAASLSVSGSSSRVAFPASTSDYNAITLYNAGSTDLFFAIGNSSVTATTSSTPLAAGASITFWINASTNVAAITASSTTTMKVYQSNGILDFKVAGAAGGGGGAVTVADGADVTQGAKADAAWVSGDGTTISLLKNIATGVGSPVPAGTAIIGQVGIDQTTPGTTNKVVASVASGGIASGAIASGAIASGAIASGAIASGAIAAGAQVDLLTMRGTKAAGTAAANSMLTGGVYNSTIPTLTDGQQASLQLNSSGSLRVRQGNAYPDTATPYTATATGTTGATTATLAGASSVTTYICGFSIRANATAAATGNATVTGTITGTLNFTQWTAPNASGLGITEMIFSPCVPASAANTSIAVVSAAPGTGGVVSVTSWGYKL